MSIDSNAGAHASLDRARRARRAGALLERAGEDAESAQAFERARAAYAEILGVADGHTDLDQLDERAERAVLGPAATKRTRNARMTVVAIGVATTLGYIAFAMGVRPVASVHASGVFFDQRRVDGAKAVDGQVATEWHLPDGERGTLDVTLFPDCDVRAVVVHNGHNRHYRDRAVRSFEIDLLRDGVRVESVRGEFDRIRAQGDAIRLPLTSKLEDVDAIRVRVHSFHGLGAALAEVELQ